MVAVAYVKVKLTVEIPDGSGVEQTLNNVVQEMDYNFTFAEDGVRIKDTEIFSVDEYEIIC